VGSVVVVGVVVESEDEVVVVVVVGDVVVGDVDVGSDLSVVVGTVVVVIVAPEGMGLPGGSTMGALEEPGGGRRVTVCLPSGPTLTTAVVEVAVVPSGKATPVTVIVSPGTALPGIISGPDKELLLPARTSPPPAEEEGVANSAMAPKAVARTTPLAASKT
jgi:hypothetical protein